LAARLGVLLAVFVILAISRPALAQRSQRYTPSRPTVSPYFGFFQFNTSPLPNYWAFVRPEQEMMSFAEREEQRIDRLERTIRLRESDEKRSLLRDDPDELGAPARAATYQDLRGFYPLQRAVQPRR
jgi:hypothetical protein